MHNKYQRRHSRLYEVILLNSWLQMALGYLLVVVLPGWMRWGASLFVWPLPDVQLNTMLANTVAYILCYYSLHKFKRYPGTRTLPFILPTVLLSWLLVFAVLLFLREEQYARQVLISSSLLALFWSFAGYFLGRRYNRVKLALVPFGRALELVGNKNAEIVQLQRPDLEGRRYDGIVVDLHAADLPGEWERFLAQCTLARIPVYHSQQMIESLTGRVRVEHLSENMFGELLPSASYALIKRLIDLLAVILLLPFLLPIMLVTAVLIRLDSPGDIFYTQQRMGFRGKIFTMYKFRSMRNDVDGKGFTEGEEDPRITRVGKFIRKYRIDELPQMLNILKGQMSLIGPRPESLELSTWYEQDVPFFSYRHVVRPGISGWAQVNHGYAAEVEGMRVKIEHDFYYIKHFSLWLDILITVKTIRTILTGFGAR
ncbi:MAG: exopolysaccharide biosynthesis polyprenyl glycosylphosphotransferase [Thiopseudomonas sp.]